MKDFNENKDAYSLFQTLVLYPVFEDSDCYYITSGESWFCGSMPALLPQFAYHEGMWYCNSWGGWKASNERTTKERCESFLSKDAKKLTYRKTTTEKWFLHSKYKGQNSKGLLTLTNNGGKYLGNRSCDTFNRMKVNAFLRKDYLENAVVIGIPYREDITFAEVVDFLEIDLHEGADWRDIYYSLTQPKEYNDIQSRWVNLSEFNFRRTTWVEDSFLYTKGGDRNVWGIKTHGDKIRTCLVASTYFVQVKVDVCGGDFLCGSIDLVKDKFSDDLYTAKEYIKAQPKK